MSSPDLNQLFVLNAQYSRKAASFAPRSPSARSPSAMSRALSRSARDGRRSALGESRTQPLFTAPGRSTCAKASSDCCATRKLLLPSKAPDLRRWSNVHAPNQRRLRRDLRARSDPARDAGRTGDRSAVRFPPVEGCQRFERWVGGPGDWRGGCRRSEVRQLPLFRTNSWSCSKPLRRAPCHGVALRACAHVGVCRQTVDRGWVDDAP